MIRRLFVLVLAAALLLGCASVRADANSVVANGGVFYVYTDNGGTLNVRQTPNGRVIDKLEYGTQVYIDLIRSDGWAELQYRYDDGTGMGDHTAYVQSRFLTRTVPDARPNGNNNNNNNTANDAAKTLAALNSEYNSARKVDSFVVVARPARASGWVNLRWGPNAELARIATCPAGKELTVIAETRNWYQVYDSDTGLVGFISRKYVTEK